MTNPEIRRVLEEHARQLCGCRQCADPKKHPCSSVIRVAVPLAMELLTISGRWRMKDADELVEIVFSLQGEEVKERAAAIIRGWPTERVG